MLRKRILKGVDRLGGVFRKKAASASKVGRKVAKKVGKKAAIAAGVGAGAGALYGGRRERKIRKKHY